MGKGREKRLQAQIKGERQGSGQRKRKKKAGEKNNTRKVDFFRETRKKGSMRERNPIN